MSISTLAEYTVGDDLGDLQIFWQANDGSYFDFSGGWTFTLTVYDKNGTKFTTNDGFVGAAGSSEDPSVIKQWATTGELTTLKKGEYKCRVSAIRSADGRKRTKTGTIRMLPDS